MNSTIQKQSLKDTEEKRRHSTTLIPYSHYICRLPDDFMNVPMHWHSEFELNFILEGRGEFLCGEQKFEADGGDILVIPPNMLHTAYPCNDCRLVYFAFVFSPVLLGINDNDRCTNECIRPIVSGHIETDVLIRKDTRNYIQLKEVADSIRSCIRNNSAQADLLLKSELMRFIWILEQSGKIRHTKHTTDNSEIIRPALEYMAGHFQDTVTIGQLAELSHISQSYFMKCFKNAVGISAIEHLEQLRINAACESLSKCQDPIADIAFRCGYSNLSNFNRQFLKKVGCSPKSYRNGQRIS